MNKNTSTLYFTILLLLFVNLNCFSNTLTDSIATPKKSKLKTALNTSSKKSYSKITIPQTASTFLKSEFTESFLKKNYPIATGTNDDLKTAMAVFKKIDSTDNTTALLAEKNLSMLPIGIKKTINKTQYMLGISNAKFTPEYTELTAFVRIIIPQIDSNGKQKELFFGANNIKLSHKGGLVGDTNLVLLGDFPLKINGDKALLVLKGGMNMSTGKVENKTYVTIDCNGFKELGITADVEFSRSMLEPVDAENNVIGKTERVIGSFKTIVSNWNDILVEISLPKFQLTSFKGTCFELNNAVIDLSDIRNSKNINWPKDYQQDYLVAGNEELWRGLYVSSLQVVLPKQFKKKGSKERITFKATDLLIDRMGVSGTFSADDVLKLNEGDASKWQFSVAHFEMNFRANALTAAAFNGSIVLPVSKKATGEQTNNVALDYAAIINPIDNEYLLRATTKKDIAFSLFKAKAKFTPGSYIELKVKDGVFLPKAVLNGNLAIKGSNSQDEKDDKKTVDFQGIEFQNLQLQTVTPYITASYFGYKGEVKVANFPVTISNIAMEFEKTSASLGFTIAINLQKDSFKGATSLSIVGKFGEDEGIQKWKFHKLVINRIYLKADIGGAKFEGHIDLRNDDPIYGDGFAGNLSAEFKGGIKVEANAIFGKVEDAITNKDFRYWYVDAMVDGLTIPCGAAFVISGFGGGAYYQMKKAGFSSSFTASGSVYVPDFESGLGIKAMIHFANAAKPDAFWGGAGFEIAFNKHGGLNRISIYGEGHVMQTFGFTSGLDKLKDGLKSVVEAEAKIPKETLDKTKESNLTEAAKQVYPDKVSGQPGLNAYAAIEYDFRSSTLHGSFDLYVNFLDGVIMGRASKNRAGWAVLHFAPNKWYVHMGTPTDRLGLKMGIGSIVVEAGGYFMMGDDIPASPPPPAIVAQILKLDVGSLDYMRSENASTLGSGKGFAFGSDFSIKTGNMNFLVFYANFEAGLGFDVMVKDYGEALCKGTGQIGINGWYANGQSYAYLQGEMGIDVKLFMIRKKIPIIKGGGAVILQAKLPNPVWIRGYLGGYYDLLGGAVKGSFRFKLEFGSQCEFVSSNPLEGLKTIAEINPSEGSKDVNVFTIPQVGFNMPIEKNFVIDGETGTKTYRLKLEECTVKNEGVPVIGTLSWNNTKDLLSFNATEVLPQNSKLTLTAKVSFQENVNGTWATVYDKGQIATETEIRNFTTGTAPNNIPVTNIAYCYPVFDQKYVYQKESKQAYVVLKQGQAYLFNLKPGQSQKAFYKTTDNTASSTISYDTANKRVNIELPVLKTTKPYSLSLMTLETKTDANNNLTQNYEKQELAADVNVEIKSNKLNETVVGGEGTEMLKYNFSTSQYTSFKEKMEAKKPKQTLVEIIYMDVHALQSLNESTEPFDEIEIIGNSKTLDKPLVSVEAVLDDSYYLNEIYPLIYKGYPLENEIKLDRNTDILGVPPVKGVEVLAWYQSYIINNPSSFMLKEYLPFRYNQPSYYKSDFKDLRYKVSSKYVDSPNQAMMQKYDYLLHGEFPYIKQGTYNIKLNYILPGGQAGTSSGSIFTFNKSN
ncbi:hypothetical protein FNW52_15890 [Flavobacterium sp. ZT3R18]|uniref:hypothetical protein n=1 Tax=Flavobacterium sp. ZT3R18 TaxID=2594429 RepID=UPI00117AA716|nr:hypothetical protein [Flavobacterium sp. ZT3R18]TRX33239.1 hypothetical protein FNW52_15890 [Flavobacterium sp. ZT3R18]